MPVVCEEQTVQVLTPLVIIRITGPHLQQVPDRDLLLPGVFDLCQMLREELHHLLIHVRQTALGQSDPDQCRDEALRRRLATGQLPDPALVEVSLSNQVSVLDHQQAIQGLQSTGIEIGLRHQHRIQPLLGRCRDLPIIPGQRSVLHNLKFLGPGTQHLGDHRTGRLDLLVVQLQPQRP